ncbi:hypothetical protein PQO03_20180 [Lentisphaera profundi]|uniref:DUF4340 domain-containing protein n=1 Tax=Lentisphaera profundi TaxID=1658616 RepID=A0ABY7VZC9_9BACT|nr:hypothetical protein [Lentisphaera profundi]WDE98141.1 hypothetical protein PQO03_20180 [Lentisphaera profundi]
MKLKQLYKVLFISIGLLLLFFMTRKNEGINRDLFTPGQVIFNDVKELDSLVLEQGPLKTELHQVDGDWVVKNRFDFIADQKQINDVIIDLKNMKVAQTVDARSEDKKFYALDEQSDLLNERPVELSLNYKDGSHKKLHLGKSHAQGGKAAGRYYLDPENQGIFISTQILRNTQADPRVWLRKFLPDYKAVLSVSYYSRERLIWQAGRSYLSKPFKFKYPTELSKMTDKQAYSFMSQIFQARYLDVEVARPIKKLDFQGERLEFVDHVGRIYTLELLAREGKLIKCRMRLNTDADLSGAKDYDGIKQTLSEWHFMLSERLLPFMQMKQ